jgi:hypothetical protein
MKQSLLTIVFTLFAITACAPEKPIPFDRSMSALKESGYTLSAMNVPDMRCLQGGLYEETSLVFMQLYCAIKDEIDMITIAFNANDSQEGTERMMEVLELIGFPHTQVIPDFISQNEADIFDGIQVNQFFGRWKIYASTEESGADRYLIVSFHSQYFLEEVEEH